MAAVTNNGIKIILAIGALFVCIWCVSVLVRSDTQGIIESYDFGNDGRVEVIQLGNNAVDNRNKGRIKIFHEGNVLFESNEEYEVTGFDIGDVNNDGEEELVIGFWRYGDFGKELDYQQVRRDPKKSFHLYVYKYSLANDGFYLVWGSSTLPHPIYEFEITRKDEVNVLKVEEGSYEDYDNKGEIFPVKISHWVWNEWWFEESE